MDLVAGAMGNLAPKLLQLLQDEYKLQKGLKEEVKSLVKELESTHVALCKVAQVPHDQLDPQDRIWARDVREASYDMEDILDNFLVHVDGGGRKPASADKDKFKHFLEKVTHLFSLNKVKARHEIASAIKNIKKQLKEVAERRDRYKVHQVVAKPSAASTIDPRMKAMNQKVTQLVGIHGAMDELISRLSLQRDDEVSNDKQLKIVSVHGTGGLGKTALAKAVYDKLRAEFDCGAFVPVGRDPDMKKVLRDILIDLDENKYMDLNMLILDERQLIKKLQDFLETKRYIIVIDDIWGKEIWEIIRVAFKDENSGSRILLSTRNSEIIGSEVYKPKPLSDDNSKCLFYSRIFGEGKYPNDNEVDKVSNKILRKCGGIPLAIITMAGLLVGKSKGEWLEVCESTGFRDNDTMSILSLSYYDLPLQQRICLLYLCAFPEDHIIDKNSLIWRWIAEDFVQKNQEGIVGLFEVGEGYFNDLVNRSLIQAVESKHNGIIVGCRVHDMVLDLLRFLSSEENFVTVLGIGEGTSSISSARRLAHQKGTADARLENNRDALEKMRSLIAFRYLDDKELPFWRFELLRVLCLESVYMRSWHNAKNLGNLLHLRYLGFKHTDMAEVPKEIGDLKFLQTLHLVQNLDIKELPLSVGQLTNLVCLHACGSTQFCVPNGIIKKLASLEELLVQCGEDKYRKYKGQFKELRNLGKLRVLTIEVIGMNQSMLSDLLQCVGYLHKLESIKLEGHSVFSSLCGGTMFDAVMLPRRRRHLLLQVPTLSRFPSCIDPSLINLTHLELDVIAMDNQSMQILGGLPELHHLVLTTESTVTVNNIAVDGCFQKLRSCKVFSSVVLFVLNEDLSVSFTLWNGRDDIVFGSRKKGECTRAPAIMPNLQELSFAVKAFWSMRKYDGIYGNLGLDYLTSLQKLTVIFNYRYCYSEALMTQVEARLRHAIDVHPSHPALIFNRIDEVRSQVHWHVWQSMKKFPKRSGQNKVSGGSHDDVSSPVIEQQEDDG